MSPAIVVALALVAVPAVAGPLIKPGRPAFDPASLAAWEGRLVGAIEVEGREDTREALVRPRIRTAVGSPLVPRVVAEDVTRLANLGVFADVRAEVAEIEPEGAVRVTFLLSETYAILPVPAILYTEENGFSFGVGVSAPNLAGRAMKLGGKAFFGGTEQYWVTFDAPWLYRGGDHHSFNAYLARVAATTSCAGSTRPRTRPARPSVVLPRRPRAGDRRRDLFLDGERGRRHHLVRGRPRPPAGRDRRADLGHARRLGGAPERLANELELTRYSQFDGPASFWRLNLDLRRWVPTTRRQKLLLSSLLTLQSGTLGGDVPGYLDYYIGGANTVRGYAATEGAVSGKDQLLGTAEYSAVLMSPRQWDILFLSVRLGLEFAVFADAGIAWTDAREFALDRTRAGLGAGVRLLAPGTEMVRFDVGWSGEQGFQFHFATGSKPVAQRQRLR